MIKLEMDNQGVKVQMTFYDKVRNDQSGDKVQMTFYDKFI
jgi:hypothetical protein